MGTIQRSSPQQVLRIARNRVSRLHARRATITAFVARHQLTWDISMAVLALLFLGIGFFEDHPSGMLDEATLAPVEWAITAVFFAEFVLRLYAAESRRRYFKGHWIDLLALLPALRVLRFLRLTRLAYLFNAARALRLAILIRFLAEIDRVGRDLHGVAKRNGVPVFLALAGGIVLAGGALVWELEHTANPAFRNFGDAIWWTFATMSTVGYGPGPETPWGRVLAAVIMVVGIACFGVLTATVSAYFVERGQRQETQEMEVSLHDVMAALHEIQMRLDLIEQRDRPPLT